MNNDIFKWLLGALATWNVGITLTLAAIRLEQVKMRVAIDLLVDGLGEKIAKVLHSPDDHLGLDQLLDKYLDKQYDLTIQEWNDLKFRCNEITENMSISKNERLMAGFLSALCDHKLMVFKKV